MPIHKSIGQKHMLKGQFNYNNLSILQARLYTGSFLGQPAIVKERFSKKYR